MFRFALPVYALSRLCVIAGAAIVASELRVDASRAEQMGTLPDVHGSGSAGSALRPIADVLASWDGAWYLDIVRNGYPTSIPAEITYFQDEARAAFFPLFPTVGRLAILIFPGGDSLAVLAMNMLIGLVAVVLVGMLASRLYGERVGRAALTLVALFPGSFVLSFAYSEGLMVALAAACMLCLHGQRWILAGVFAALVTATRPNGVAIVLACAFAAFAAIREQDKRDWAPVSAVLLAPVGFVTFQVWLGIHTAERLAWLRVQREAWGEGASFGLTALRNTAEAVLMPLTSPTDTITAVSLASTVLLVIVARRANLPLWMNAYSFAILVLMLTPATVTARPRFIFTAFPLLIGAAKWYDDRRSKDDNMWALTTAACGAGLVALTALYGVFGAIP